MSGVDTAYDLLAGPFLWVAFVVFLFGSIAKVVFLLVVSRSRDKVLYDHISLKWGLKSILHWIVPFASVSMRKQPIFTFVAFAFHISLLATPIFLLAHNMLWDSAFGVSLRSMPDLLADILTVAVVFSGLFLFARRLARPEVRVLTSAWDYALLILTILPFVTGFLAFHGWGPYKLVLTLHMFFGEVLLVLIPFSKLSHGIVFFLTRAFIGFDMGGRRGVRAW